MNKPTTIDGYLEPLDEAKRQALEKLRVTIRQIVPQAEECISYGLPCFRLDGQSLVGFGAAKNHCAFYPWSGKTVEEFHSQLQDFETSKGAIRFQPEKPLPVGLVRKMIRSRILQNELKGKKAVVGKVKVVDRTAIQRTNRGTGGKTKNPGRRTDRGAINDHEAVLALLKRNASKSVLNGMARYGLPSQNALGVSVGTIKKLAAPFSGNHDLALKLWETGIYEARMMCSYVDDPARVTAAQMDRWCRDFDNWGICDTICFHLFDRTPHAWKKVTQWAVRRDEYVRRAAFALLWGLTVHDKTAGNNLFLNGLGLIEKAATDERHYVKKAVNMALRATGKRNAVLNAAAVEVATRLTASGNVHAQWVGKDALRELVGASVVKRLAKKQK